MKKHFCCNPICPNHEMELNLEKHYHTTDGAIGGICGIVKTNKITVKKQITNNIKKWKFFNIRNHHEVSRDYYFCDNCYKAIQIYEGLLTNV